MNAIIIEDEEEGMQNLVLKLTKHCPEITIIDKCATGEKAVRAIRDKNPQLIFLDIQLGTMSGFDVLNKVQHIPFEIIFTTAYDDYTIEAIRHSAVDYILKPVRPAELKEAVKRAAERIQTHKRITRIIVPDGNKQLILHTKDIMYCLADNVNTYIHLVSKQRPLFVVKTLKSIESMLPQDLFHRISRGTVVNLDYVEAIHRSEGGYVCMQNREELSISRSRLSDFLRKLGSNL